MKLKSACSGAWIALLAAAVDRVGKSLMLRHEPGEIVRAIPGILQFRRTANTGMAFSLFSENGAALTILTAVLIAAVVVWLSIRPEEQSKTVRAGLWLMAGGGLGNLYDRLVYGSVIDFIDPIFVRFAVFNPADAFICVGAALAFVALLRDERRKAKDAAAE